MLSIPRHFDTATRPALLLALEITKKHLGMVVRAVEEPLSAIMAVASANDAREIERLEQAAFDELGTLLAQPSLRRRAHQNQRRARRGSS